MGPPRSPRRRPAHAAVRPAWAPAGRRGRRAGARTPGRPTRRDGRDRPGAGPPSRARRRWRWGTPWPRRRRGCPRGRVREQRLPVAQAISHLRGRETERRLGHEVNDGALVPVVVARLLEPRAAELDQVGGRGAHEPEETEREVEIVDDGR